MNIKKGLLLLVFLAVMISLFSNFVSAAEEKGGLEGAFETIRKLFGFLPEVITLEKLVGGDAAAVFWAKFLVWLLLFALIYFGATAIPGLKDNKRIATVVALVISLMSALLIPNEIVINIFQTYGLVAGILLWFIPLGAALYLNHKIQNRWLRVLILFISLIILMNINTTLGKISGLGAWFDYFGLLLGIILIMFLWNLGAAVFGEDRAEGARGWAADNVRDAWDWATRTRGGAGPGGRGPGPGGGRPRPPGPMPPVTPPNRNPTDPPTPPGILPPGLNPHAPGPKPTPPKLPKKPKIPDEKEIFIDLSEYFNPIRSQDRLGACTAFAATSIFEYILHVGYEMPRRYLSPLFLWYRTRETIGAVNNDTGPRTCAVPMTNLVKDGVCFEELWSFADSSNPKWRARPDEQAVADAVRKKVIKFYSLDRNDPDQWVHALLEKYPINIGVNFPRDMAKPYKKRLYDNFGGRSNIGCHAMVIVGYHSHYPYQGRGIKAFKIRNSHDVDWGENGYTWVPAEILRDMLFEDPIVIMGWKKDSYYSPEKREDKAVLEQIKEYAKEEKDWLAAEYKFLNSLKEFVYSEKYQEANKIMRQVGRSERKSFDFEKRLEENLSKLIKIIQEPYKSAIAKIKENLIILSKSLLILTSRYEGGIKNKLEYLIEKGSKMNPKEYQKTGEDLKKMVDEAIRYLRGIETDLDRLIDIEDVLEIEKNVYKKIS